MNESQTLYRAAFARSMEINLAFVPSNLSQPCVQTLHEMVEVGKVPYDYANKGFTGDTLDRHPHSVEGNFYEMVVLLVLLRLGVDPVTVDLSRTYEIQVGQRIDIICGDLTFQVKKANIGTFKELGIPKNDLAGTADFLVYVDMERLQLHIIARRWFAENAQDIAGIALALKGDKDSRKGWWLAREYAEMEHITNVVDIPAEYVDHLIKGFQ